MKSKVIMAMACASLAIGCVSTVSTGGFEVSVYEGNTAGNAVRIDDRYFAKQFSIEATNIRRESSGVVAAQVRVRNMRNKDIPIQYKFMFFDNDGMEIQPGVRSWEQTTIHGGEAASLSAVTPVKSAVRFALRVRRSL